MIIARQSTAIIVTVGPILDADGVAVTGGVVGDFKISKNGGAPAALNASATYTHRHTGYGSLSLTASDVGTVGTAEITMDDTVNACPIKEIQVIEEAVYDAFYAASAVGIPSIPAGWITAAGIATGAIDADAIADNAIDAGALAADCITNAKIADNAIAAENIAADAITAAKIANGAIDAATFAADVDAEILSYIVDDATRVDASALNTLSGHDPGATLGTSTLTQTQVTGGAYALNSASFAFNAALDFTTTQKAATLARVTLVDTTTTNTDMRGTDSAATATELAKVPKSDSNVTWNATALASIQTEANDALVANNLDHLVLSAVDTNFATTVHADSVIGQLADNGAGFDRTTDSLEAIRDRGDAAWTTAAGFSTHSAADVWAVATRVLTAGTNIVLPSNGLSNVTAWTVDITGSLSGSVGSVTTKTGYKLASDGLDLITATVPSGVATTFPQMVVQSWWRNVGGKVVYDSVGNTITLYAANGTSVICTQTATNAAGVQTVGVAG